MEYNYQRMMARITPEMRKRAESLRGAEKKAIELRQLVDAVWRELLREDEFAMYKNSHNHLEDYGERIQFHDLLYLSKDEDAFNRALQEIDHRLKLKGIKPAEMDVDRCPALVAERELLELQREILADIETILGKEKGYLDEMFCYGNEKKRCEIFALHLEICKKKLS